MVWCPKFKIKRPHGCCCPAVKYRRSVHPRTGFPRGGGGVLMALREAPVGSEVAPCGLQTWSSASRDPIGLPCAEPQSLFTRLSARDNRYGRCGEQVLMLSAPPSPHPLYGSPCLPGFPPASGVTEEEACGTRQLEELHKRFLDARETGMFVSTLNIFLGLNFTLRMGIGVGTVPLKFS